MLALREGKQLGHSRSQDNLRPIHENALDSASSNGDLEPPSPATSSSSKGKTKTPPRPSFAKLRRRSTLEWATASSLQRQKKLEDVSASRMADVFFSLHISGLEGWYVCRPRASRVNADELVKIPYMSVRLLKRQ